MKTPLSPQATFSILLLSLSLDSFLLNLNYIFLSATKVSYLLSYPSHVYTGHTCDFFLP